MGNVEIEKITENYKCPEECGNQCCKNISIGLSDEGLKNISKSGPKGKNFVRNLQKFGKMCYDQKSKKSFYKIEEKVCPFLEKNKCDLGRYKPVQCIQFPFIYLLKAQMHAIELCPMGQDIAKDLDIADFLFWHEKNPRSTDQKLCKIIESNNNTLAMKEEGFFEDQEVDSLQIYLLFCYLESTSVRERTLIRESISNGDLIEALKHDEMIIWEIKFGK